MTTSADSLNSAAVREKIAADLRTLIADSEELLRLTAGQAGEKISAARDRVQASLAVAREKLAVAERAVVEKTKEAARATDDYVHDHPWRAVGVAAFAGLVLGILIGRR